MGGFSLLSVAASDEVNERYMLLKMLGKKIGDSLIPAMPDFNSCIINDMGIKDVPIRGCRIGITPYYDSDKLAKKLRQAKKISGRFGANVIVMDPSINEDAYDTMMMPNFIISKGLIYPPAAVVECAKSVAALLGIDFLNSNICVADASTKLGRMVTELLLDEAMYLTLWSKDRAKLMEPIDGYILKTGISPAVISSIKKAAQSCDILICTGGEDIPALTECMQRKALILNLTQKKINISKDFLAVDEVILEGHKEIDISGKCVDRNIFKTSRVWEGALLTLCQFNPLSYSAESSKKIGNLGKKLGLKAVSAVSGGKVLSRESIYRYR